MNGCQESLMSEDAPGVNLTILTEQKKCSKCGIDKPSSEFRSSHRRCRLCRTEEQHKWVKEHREKTRVSNLKYSSAHRKEKCAYAKKWRSANPERARINRDRWKATHSDWEAQRQRDKQEKKRSTIMGNLNSTMSKRMNESLQKGMKAGRHWEELVGYTVEELKSHLQNQFTKDMNWGNYGDYWSIDHIIPVSAFNFKTYNDIDFNKCWALENLQPMIAVENSRKNARLKESFQPSLAL